MEQAHVYVESPLSLNKGTNGQSLTSYRKSQRPKNGKPSDTSSWTWESCYIDLSVSCISKSICLQQDDMYKPLKECYLI
jgi:hypothetical protein